MLNLRILKSLSQCREGQLNILFSKRQACHSTFIKNKVSNNKFMVKIYLVENASPTQTQLTKLKYQSQNYSILSMVSTKLP